MKKKRGLFYFLLGVILLINSCQKEYSFEGDRTVMPGASLAAFTLNGAPNGCMGASVAGTYVLGATLTDSNTVTIKVNVTKPGAYSVSSTPVNGITFSSSGNFASTGTQTITLSGGGTPVAAGSFTIPVSFGSSGCSFNTEVRDTSTSNWQFNVGTEIYKGHTDDAILNSNVGLTTLIIKGPHNNGTGFLRIMLHNTSGAISTGIYSGITPIGKFVTYSYTDAGIFSWIGAPPIGTTLSVNLTVYDTVTHIAEGTFSGSVVDGLDYYINITSGSFKAFLP